jgi:hypothetical protein
MRSGRTKQLQKGAKKLDTIPVDEMGEFAAKKESK